MFLGVDGENILKFVLKRTVFNQWMYIFNFFWLFSITEFGN